MSTNRDLPKSPELNSALDLVLRFMCDHLPTGWEIHIEASTPGAAISLIDPGGDDVACDIDSDDVRRLVNEAREKCGMPLV